MDAINRDMMATGILYFLSCWTIFPTASAAETTKLTRIAAGTVTEELDGADWNRVVLLARPRLSSGDTSAVPRNIRDIVSTFALTILASVQDTTDTLTGTTKYQLADVGVGLSMEIDGVRKVVTLDAQKKLGADLGFIQRQILSNSEGQLDSARLVAKTSTLFIFDTPTIMLREGSHVDLITRHFIWIDSRTGQNSALIWLIGRTKDGTMVPVNEAMRWIPAGMEEDRRIHVDVDQFLLGGIPTERAFALEDLPPGKVVQWTTRARALAGRPSFDADSLRELTLALNEALQTLK